MKAIETIYKGYRFRSRLEARWAVFFEALGLKWEYEPEGFDLGAAGRYLPDFFISDLNGGNWKNGGGTWVEVKPNSDCLKAEEGKWKALVEQSGKMLLLAVGTPEQRIYDVLIRVDLDEYVESYGAVWAQACFYRNHDDKPRLSMSWTGAIEDANCFGAINTARAARFEHGETPA